MNLVSVIARAGVVSDPVPVHVGVALPGAVVDVLEQWAEIEEEMEVTMEVILYSL